MFAIYAVFDGFDMGVGIVYLLAARTDAERRTLLGSIGPVWDGNEVWLIAGGGTLFFAFPAAYASGFSGFYLPVCGELLIPGEISNSPHTRGRRPTHASTPLSRDRAPGLGNPTR